jgi:hypothetical protein
MHCHTHHWVVFGICEGLHGEQVHAFTFDRGKDNIAAVTAATARKPAAVALKGACCRSVACCTAGTS